LLEAGEELAAPARRGVGRLGAEQERGAEDVGEAGVLARVPGPLRVPERALRLGRSLVEAPLLERDDRDAPERPREPRVVSELAEDAERLRRDCGELVGAVPLHLLARGAIEPREPFLPNVAQLGRDLDRRAGCLGRS